MTTTTCPGCHIDRTEAEFDSIHDSLPDDVPRRRKTCMACQMKALIKDSLTPEQHRAAMANGADPRRHQDPEGHAEYVAIHRRLRVERGPADEHRCTCGSRAAHWALQDGYEWIESDLHTYGVDIDAYSPRCTTCHAEEDRGHRLTGALRRFVRA